MISYACQDQGGNPCKKKNGVTFIAWFLSTKCTGHVEPPSINKQCVGKWWRLDWQVTKSKPHYVQSVNVTVLGPVCHFSILSNT